tara:strand:+ start:1029 stop:1985 length:957 start_codon:yes stop_codon:yes gene_type:complete
MSNVVDAYFYNRTPEVEALYAAYRRGEVDIFGNRRDAPGYSLANSVENPNLTNTSVIGQAPSQTTNTSTAATPDNSNNLLTSFGLNELYKEILGRPFTDGDDIASVYLSMTPDEAREYLVAQPEALIYQQAGDSLNLANRTELLGEYTGGLLNTTDSNLDGVVDINDLLFDMGRAGYGPELPTANVGANNAGANNVTTNNLPAAQSGFGTTPTTEVLNPYYGNLVPMQITPGSDIMATNVSSNFFGIDPITNQLGLLSDPQQQNLMFRSGVAGFTDNLPTGFEFGIPAVVADVPIFYPKAYQDFLDAKEAEANPSGDK